MENYGKYGEIMENFGKCMENYGKCMENYEKCMENVEKLREIMENYGKYMENYCLGILYKNLHVFIALLKLYYLGWIQGTFYKIPGHILYKMYMM